MAELLGVEALAALPASLRLVALVTEPLHAPAAQIQIGVPTAVERTGTWINVDGFAGPLAAARPAPRGVRPLTATLEDLAAHLAPAAGAEAAV